MTTHRRPNPRPHPNPHAALSEPEQDAILAGIRALTAIVEKPTADRTEQDRAILAIARHERRDYLSAAQLHGLGDLINTRRRRLGLIAVALCVTLLAPGCLPDNLTQPGATRTRPDDAPVTGHAVPRTPTDDGHATPRRGALVLPAGILPSAKRTRYEMHAIGVDGDTEITLAVYDVTEAKR